MSARDGVPTGMWVLGGLLALSWAVLSLGTGASQSQPGPREPAPGGLSAFADLLEAQGYRVRVDERRRPKIARDELAVAAFTGAAANTPYLDGHLAEGGRVLALPVPSLFDSESVQALAGTTILEDGMGTSFTASQIEDRSELLPEELTLDQSDAWAIWFHRSEVDFAVLYRVGDGVVCTVADGMIATNRFLARHDNAAVMLQTVRALAPQGATIVFLPDTYGAGVELGLLETIGPWAAALGGQGLWLFVVIAWTLGRRFGLPDSTAVPQRGAAELVDGMSQIYDRARATPIALEAAAKSADLRIQRELKLPRGTPHEIRNRRIPASLAQSLAEVEAARSMSPLPSEALRLVRKLDRELADAFGHGSRRPSQGSHRL